jgi:hypothetical protein
MNPGAGHFNMLRGLYLTGKFLAIRQRILAKAILGLAVLER